MKIMKKFKALRKTEEKDSNESHPKFVEGIDYYFDAGLMVLTARYLEKRGYCCDNGCRHCPYPKAQKSNLQ